MEGKLMSTYTLTASGSGKMQTVTLEATDDIDAITIGALTVMRNAYPNVQPWASGRITLANSDGTIISEMKEKTDGSLRSNP